MPIDSLRDVEATVAEIAADLSPVLVEVGASLATGQATDGQLGRLNGALETARTDLRSLRDGLGAVDVADYQIGTDAADRLRLWDWQLSTLSRARTLVAGAQKAQGLIAELAEGRRLETHEVRSGETLQSIAQARLGDWREWHRLVEANGLDPAAVLTPGRVLVIPER